MAKDHAIGWLNRPGTTPVTWNPIVGCSQCSPVCEHCYAERLANRLASMDGTRELYGQVVGPHRKWNGTTALSAEAMEKPFRWRKPRTVFVCSMGDLFHGTVPIGWITHVLDAMDDTPQHTYLLLTKRPNRMRRSLNGSWGRDGAWRYMRAGDFLPNVWLGVTVCTQEEADRKIPILLDTPAAVRFVSIEPMLGGINISQWLRPRRMHMSEWPAEAFEVVAPECLDETRLDWVICGGESGPGARPMHPEWVRRLRDQCVAAGVPFFLKQWGEWAPRSQVDRAVAVDKLRGRCRWGTLTVDTVDGEWFEQTTPWNGHDDDGHGEAVMLRVGRKAAGHFLDGEEWRQFPEQRSEIHVSADASEGGVRHE